MNWATLIPTLVGAGISVLTTAVMFVLNQKVQNKKELQRKEAEAALNAYVGLQKLMNTANYLFMLNKHLATEFAEAQGAGNAEEEPALIVREFVGAPAEIQRVTPKDSAFLNSNSGFQLVAEIWQIESRAQNSEAAASTFNDVKREFSQFLHSIEDGIEIADSARLRFQLEGDDARRASVFIGQLNSLVGTLVHHLEEDTREVKRIVNEYVAAASMKFGDRFPLQSVEWKV
ncbi:hypothetical protein [Ruegeria arenilitoris]|uniref:hypothetical protein n=1 Tax=Ruegeria arenilitoris TaxID=1173585 RepID=UPI001479894F|nr:hypothetical protein [Ruegeria arenilitoris]